MFKGTIKTISFDLGALIYKSLGDAFHSSRVTPSHTSTAFALGLGKHNLTSAALLDLDSRKPQRDIAFFLT